MSKTGKKGPPKGSRRKEYPSNVVRFAQRLYDENGYTMSQVLSALECRGYHPTRETVRRWVDPEYRQAVYEAKRVGGNKRTRTRPWKFRLARIRELREVVGLSAAATARLMNHDFNLSLSRHQIEALLAGDIRLGKTTRRLLYPEGQHTPSPASPSTKKGHTMLRQGDILLVPVAKLPNGLTEVPREDGKIVLAEGEATGHLHMIEAPEATFLAKDIAEIEGRFLQVEEEVALVHPEHDTVTLEPGAYEVRRQREYTQAGGIELVSD